MKTCSSIFICISFLFILWAHIGIAQNEGGMDFSDVVLK